MWFFLLCIAVLSATLVSAAVYDAVSREVPDVHWAVCGTVGSLMSASMFHDCGQYVAAAFLAAGLLLTAYLVWERLDGVPGTAVLLLSSVLYLLCVPSAGSAAAVTPAATLFFLGLYYLGAIRGGADVKALVCMAVAFPMYPQTDMLPLVWETDIDAAPILSFPFSVLLWSSAVSLIPAAAIGVRNLVRGDIRRGMFSSFEMGLCEAESSFVWPVEDVRGGEKVLSGIPDEPPEVYGRLRDAGFANVKVTPMVPFVVPIAASVILMTVFGNPLFAVI